MENRNLVAVNDCYVPIPNMECRNLVSVNDCFGPPYLIWNAGTFYLSMTYGPHTLYGW